LRAVEALAHLPQEIEPSLPVVRVEINVFTPITACRDVIETTGKLDT
jgi:hypothetical protein